jgi:hypothetical protein
MRVFPPIRGGSYLKIFMLNMLLKLYLSSNGLMSSSQGSSMSCDSHSVHAELLQAVSQ